MSQYRGVFIAPSGINKKTHRRSKTYPHSSQKKYKTELSHLPRGESLPSLYSLRAPKIPGLLKPVTLRFRTFELGKRETSTCELQCSPLGNSAKKSRLELQTLDRTGWSTDRTCDTLVEHTDKGLIDSESEKFCVNLSADCNTFENLHNRVHLHNSKFSGEDIVDQRQCSSALEPKDSIHSSEPVFDGRGLLITEPSNSQSDCQDSTFRILPKIPDTKSKINANDCHFSIEKKLLTFGKTVFPDGFDSDSLSSGTSEDCQSTGEGDSVSSKEDYQKGNKTEHLNKSHCTLNNTEDLHDNPISPDFRSAPLEQLALKSVSIEDIDNNPKNVQSAQDRKKHSSIVSTLDHIDISEEPPQLDHKNQINHSQKIRTANCKNCEDTQLIKLAQSDFELDSKSTAALSRSEDEDSKNICSKEAQLVKTQQEVDSLKEQAQEWNVFPVKPIVILEKPEVKPYNVKEEFVTLHNPPICHEPIRRFSGDCDSGPILKVLNTISGDIYRDEDVYSLESDSLTQHKTGTVTQISEIESILPLGKTTARQLKSPTFPITVLKLPDSRKKAEANRQTLEYKTTSPASAVGEIAIEIQEHLNEKLLSFSDNSEEPFTPSPHTPIVFNFETENITCFNFEEGKSVSSPNNSSRGTANSSSGAYPNVCCDSFSNDFDSKDFFITPIRVTSTPNFRSETAVKRLFSEPSSRLDTRNSHSEKDIFVEKNSEGDTDSEEITMASLPPQNVKAKRELLESREKIRQFEERLLNEQKISEDKEKAIKSLTKELQSFKTKVNQDNDSHENMEEMKSKLTTFETDNRILANQVQMVEEANKKLYKELYETKTQLRFQQRRSDDVCAQNTQASRRLSQVLQSSMDKSTGFTVFLHQMESDLILADSVLRKLRAQRQALEEVLKSEDETFHGEKLSRFDVTEKPTKFLTDEVKNRIREQFETSLEYDFTDEVAKQLHCDQRMVELEDIINECMINKFEEGSENLSMKKKKIGLARAHVKAVKDIEAKFIDLNEKSQKQIATMKGRVSNDVKETAKEISSTYLAKQEIKGKQKRKASTLESPQVIRRKSVEELAGIDRTLRSIKSKSQVTRNDLSENEKEILSLNEKICRTLDDKIKMSEELLETQSKIQELENRYAEKQRETESLEKELSSKRQEISEMAKEMHQSLTQQIESADSMLDLKGDNENTTKLADKGIQVDDLKEELEQAIMLLETEQQERQDALKMNEDLFFELENREQEISGLVMRLESRKDKESYKEEGSNACKKLKNMINSEENPKIKCQLELLHADFVEEIRASEKEAGSLQNELTKQQKDSESLIVLVDYYKEEMTLLQKQCQENPATSFTTANGQDNNDQENCGILYLPPHEFTPDKFQQLQDDVLELQEALENQRNVNQNSRDKHEVLESALQKEKEAKEYAYRRNRELEEELRIKDLKLSTLSYSAAKKQPEKNPKAETPGSTISELRCTMAQIQCEKENLSKELDNLAVDMENSVVRSDHLGQPLPEKVVDTPTDNAAILQSNENSFFSEPSKKYVETKQAEQCSMVNLATEKEKIVEELEQTIKTLEKEVHSLRSQNTLLEDEAVDVVDNGLKIENKIFRNQIKSLSNELAIARADGDYMKREFDHMESRSNEMVEELARINSSKDALEKRNGTLDYQNKLLNQELDLLKNKVEVLEQEKEVITGGTVGIDVVDSKAIVEDNEALKTDIAKITLDLKVNKEETERLKSELRVSEDTVKDLQLSLASLQKEKASLQIQIDDLNFVNKTREKELNLLNQKLAVLEVEIRMVERDLAQRSDEVHEKLVIIQNLEKNNAKKETEKMELEDKVKVNETWFAEAKNAEEKKLTELTEKNKDLQAQLDKIKMDSSDSKQEQQRLERDLNELRERLREADRKFTSTRDDKTKTEDSLGSMKNRVGQLQKELNYAKAEIREKHETIRKLNLRNSELQISLAEREQELRREERLRMDNMKAMDALKIKIEKMETDEKKQRDRLFSLKSACSEANEAYEIVKRQNFNLRNDMQDLKKKFAERDVQAESNKREKEKLEEQILNASRTIDDIRKYTITREQSLSPDSALGISITSLTELGSGLNSPNSESSDSPFTSGEEELKFIPQEQGLLCKMPTMIENFRVVVRDNELMKTKLVEIMSNKEKMNSQLQHYSALSDDLQKEIGEKDQFLSDLEEKNKMLEDELSCTKTALANIERNFASTASEADIVKTTLKARDDTLHELKEKVELLKEKENALDLYSKSMSEKYHNEVSMRDNFETTNKNLQEKNEKQKQLLESLEKKLSEYSSRPRRVSEPEVKSIAVPAPKPVITRKESDIAMATLEGKLESIVEYSEVLESSLMDVEMWYRNLQAENERLKNEKIDMKEYDSLKSSFEEQDKSFKEQNRCLQDQIDNFQEQLHDLEVQNEEKEESLQDAKNKEKELLKDFKKLKDSFLPLEEANGLLKAELENLREESKQAEESRINLGTDLQIFKTKIQEMEMTTEAYKDENSRLRSDIIALSEEKCQLECKVSEVERREKRLDNLVHQERAERQELKQVHDDTLSTFGNLQNDMYKAKETITRLEAMQSRTEQTNSEMEQQLGDVSTLKSNLEDELLLTKKSLNDIEGRFKKALDEEEILKQKLSKLGLDNSRLSNACEQNQKRKSDLEREVVEANGKNEELEAEIEKVRIEKTGLLKEITQKEETIQSMETKKSELEEESQKLTNHLYLSTKKVLSLQLNLESLRNDVTQLGKELRKLVLGAIGRQTRDEVEEKSMETDLEMSLFENEVVIQALRQTIKSTEKSMDIIRPEAKISELENKLCQKDIDSVHREFAFLKDQLGSFRHSCQKLSDETRRLKEDIKTKDSVLQDTVENLEVLKEENLDSKEKIVQLQSKCNGLEILTAEYEQTADTSTNDMIRANQTIASLEATIAKQDQRKIVLEKERLVMQERLNNLENNQRVSKDEIRNDKKRIALLEVESSEKQGLLRELEKIEANFSELKLKYEDALKDREEVKAELVGLREELRQEEVELKNSKRDVDNFKKHIVIEREMRQRVEQDLNEHVEELKTCKKNLNIIQRSQSKLEDDNEIFLDKNKELEEGNQALKKQLEVQSIEVKRLKDSLADTRNEFLNANEKYENAEKERKRLSEDLVHSEEQEKKLQDACNEFLREKMLATEKVASLSETLEAMIVSHEYSLNNLKQDLMISNKDLSITRSSLERSQQRNDELLQDIRNQENKTKAMDEKKQEFVEKFWDSQNQLSEAQSCLDSLRAETKELKGKVSFHLSKIEQLEETIKTEHEENENTIESLNGKISSLKVQGNALHQERDILQSNLEATEEALSKTSEDLKQASKSWHEKEKYYTIEIAKRDQTIDNLKNISETQRADVKKTKDSLKDVCRENVDLKEKLGTTEKALENLESKVSEHQIINVDALAEAQAKLKVLSKIKASNSDENFVELRSTPLLGAGIDDFDSIDGILEYDREASIKDIVDAFHQTCMVSFNDNRELHSKLSKANESNAMLENSLYKERNVMAETKRDILELEKKKSRLEEEVRRLRQRLETFKQKSIELERSKDDELCELRGENVILDKENWALKETVEELKAKSKETEAERDRYAEEVLFTQRQIVEARDDIKHAQEKIDKMQEQLLETKKRTFELEAREKSLQQKITEREKEVYASKIKEQELEKLYNCANEKKTELYAQISKAEEKVTLQENLHEENQIKEKEMEREIEALKMKVSQLTADLGNATQQAEEAKDKIEELEIQRGSLQATNEIFKHQLELSKSENEALKKSYTTTHDESLNLAKSLNDVSISKENLQTEIQCLSREKERLQDVLTTSECKLRESEDNFVKAFQESENLKRQMLKIQSTACAESVKSQAEVAKLKSELDSMKKEAIEKEKDYIEKVIKLKGTEKENDSLKRELTNIHLRESELKLDYTTTNSKLQSYVLERECWEREVKTVLGEIEQQKNANATKEHRLERLRMRYEQEIGFLSERVTSLERELKIVQDASEQQRHADEIAHKLNIEAKDMEIDNLRIRLQATRIHTSDKNAVVDQMKNQLDERTTQINDLMNQMSLLKDSYNLELASVQADLKCSQMENLLKLRKDMDSDNQLNSSQDSVSDLLNAIKSSRQESERLRHLLGSRMRQMSTINRDLNTKRGARSYGLYGRDNEGHLRD